MSPSRPASPVMEMRVALTTSDFDRLEELYCAGLGLEPAQIWRNGQGRAVMIDMGRATLEIFDTTQAETVDGIEAGRRLSGRVRFAFQVPDLQAATERLLAHGARLVHPPVVTPWGDHNVRLEDPDGMQITIFQVTGSS
ncbi:MAG: VOC family protein [Chloroflexi bacterium]|nr:VOC family protein [Chloroflexota bacterium]